MRFATPLIVLLLAACGGKSFDGEGPRANAGNGSGASANGGNANGGSGGATSAGRGSGGDEPGGNAGAACDSFRDDAPSFVSVNIINDSSKRLYLGQSALTCELSPLFAVEDAAGAALPALSRCRTGCGSGSGGCTDICLVPSAIELAPGAGVQTSWDGLFDAQIDLPKQCVDPTLASGHCQKATRIEPGTFTFSATAGTSLDCTPGSSTTCEACKPDADGNCSVPSSLIAGETRTATATVQLDASYGIYPRALPAPGADAPSAPGATANVEIVFED